MQTNFPRSGKLIACMGLPGTGKSTVARNLAQQLQASFYAEPEEDEWPAAVKARHLSGQFTAISWFRSARVPQLYQAQLDTFKGRHAVVDSYFDKLFYHFGFEEGMEWLLKPDEPYYDELRGMAAKDYQNLPNADLLVLFEVDQPTWRKFLEARNRDHDSDDLLRSSFHTQDHYIAAAKTYCQEFGAEFVLFRQRWSNPYDIATELLEHLKPVLEA